MGRSLVAGSCTGFAAFLDHCAGAHPSFRSNAGLSPHRFTVSARLCQRLVQICFMGLWTLVRYRACLRSGLGLAVAQKNKTMGNPCRYVCSPAFDPVAALGRHFCGSSPCWTWLSLAGWWMVGYFDLFFTDACSRLCAGAPSKNNVCRI